MRLAVPYEPETETVAEHFGHAKWMKLYNEEGMNVSSAASISRMIFTFCRFLFTMSIRSS